EADTDPHETAQRARSCRRVTATPKPKSRRDPASDAVSASPKRWWVRGRRRCRGSSRSLYQNDGEKTHPKGFGEARDKIARGQTREGKNGAPARGGRPQGDARCAAAVDSSADRRSVPSLQGRKSGAKERIAAYQSIHTAGRGGSFGASNRRRCQQGGPCAFRPRRHTGKNGRSRRNARSRPHQ